MIVLSHNHLTKKIMSPLLWNYMTHSEKVEHTLFCINNKLCSSCMKKEGMCNCDKKALLILLFLIIVIPGISIGFNYLCSIF